jgi:WD40 repeat protein
LGVAVWSIVSGANGVDIAPRWTSRVGDVIDMALHPDGSSLVYLVRDDESNSSRLFRHDLDKGGQPRELPVVVRQNVRGLNFDSAGRLLHFVTPSGRLGSWDWHKEATVSGPDLPVFQWAPAPGGRWAAMVSADRDVLIVDLGAGRRVLTLPPEESDVWGLAWSPDAARLAVGLSDGGVTIWDMDQVRAELASFGIETPAISNPQH